MPGPMRILSGVQSSGKLHLTLTDALPAGAAMTIAIRYRGTPRPIQSYWGEVGFEELSNGETAAVLGLQKAAASNRYIRALKRLKEVLSSIPGFFDT